MIKQQNSNSAILLEITFPSLPYTFQEFEKLLLENNYQHTRREDADFYTKNFTRISTDFEKKMMGILVQHSTDMHSFIYDIKDILDKLKINSENVKKIKIILGTEFEHLAVEEFINKFYSNGLKQINDDFFESETTFATLTLSNRLEQDHDLQIKITPSITDPRENLKLEFSLATTRYSTFFNA